MLFRSDAGQWRLKKSLAGGGALMDVGIYVVQAARYITGEEPQWLFATEAKTDRVKFKEVDETICWTMKFPSGVVANCSTNYVVNGIDRCWVGAERGWFELNPAFNYTRIEGRTCEGPMRLPQTDQFALELDDFARCIVEHTPSSADQAAAIRLLAEGFDLLDEDLGKEQFFTHVRRAYWEAPEGAPMRGLMQSLMETLDF